MFDTINPVIKYCITLYLMIYAFYEDLSFTIWTSLFWISVPCRMYSISMPNSLYYKNFNITNISTFYNDFHKFALPGKCVEYCSDEVCEVSQSSFVICKHCTIQCGQLWQTLEWMVGHFWVVTHFTVNLQEYRKNALNMQNSARDTTSQHIQRKSIGI